MRGRTGSPRRHFRARGGPGGRRRWGRCLEGSRRWRGDIFARARPARSRIPAIRMLLVCFCLRRRLHAARTVDPRLVSASPSAPAATNVQLDRDRLQADLPTCTPHWCQLRNGPATGRVGASQKSRRVVDRCAPRRGRAGTSIEQTLADTLDRRGGRWRSRLKWGRTGSVGQPSAWVVCQWAVDAGRLTS